MNQNLFASRYKTLSNSALLEILSHPQDYELPALAAAQQELDNRRLTEAEMKEAQEELAERQREEAVREARMMNAGTRIGRTIGKALWADHGEGPFPGVFIKIISVFLIGMFLYGLVEGSALILFMFTDPDATWDLMMVLYFLPLLVELPAGLLLWFRKKSGWILSFLFVSYSSGIAFYSLIGELTYEPTGIGIFDAQHSLISASVHLGFFLLNGVMTAVLCLRNLRAMYGVGMQTVLVTAGVSVMLVLGSILLWFL